MGFDFARRAGGPGEHILDSKMERIIQHRIQREGLVASPPREGTAPIVGIVQHLAEHEEVGLAMSGREGVNGRAPLLPETHFHVFDSIDAKPVETGLLDPILVDGRHLAAHEGRFGPEIVQPAQFPKTTCVGSWKLPISPLL
jgi:hypothetical protein